MRKLNSLLVTCCMVCIAACSNHQPVGSNTSLTEQFEGDSIELERKTKVIDFATKMASLKAQQGFDSVYILNYRDSILKANGVNP